MIRVSEIHIFLTVVIILAFTRMIPHPPNFTSLIALSFYVPAIFGLRYLPVTFISFVITDIIIGFHSVLFFTWGSVIIIGFISKYFNKSIILRISGAFSGCLIFFFISNIGVWMTGYYGYSYSGLINCFILALPFFGNTVISTLIFSAIIEMLCKFFHIQKKKSIT